MAPITFGLPTVHYVVSYYDRNEDGLVDFELHHAVNAVDTDWAMCDTEFRGRYDVKIEYSPFGGKKPIDLPVPSNVTITPGQPESWPE